MLVKLGFLSREFTKFEKFISLLALGIYALPLVVFSHIPTQDGPLHIDTAAVMLRSLGAHSTFLRQFFEIRFPLETNTLGHYILMLFLGLDFTAEQTESCFQTVYLLLFACGALYFLAAAKNGAWRLAALLLPFAYSYIFHLGFYNNCLSFCGFLWCWGAFLHYESTPCLKNLFLLGCFLTLTWLAHPVGTVATAVGILFWGALHFVFLGRKILNRRTLALLLPQLLICLPLAGEAFFLRNANKQADFQYKNFSDLGDQLIHLSAMDSFSVSGFDVAMIGVLVGSGILFILGTYKAHKLWRLGNDPKAFQLALMCLFYLVLYFLSPTEAAGSGYINERLMLFMFFFLVALLASIDFMPRTLLLTGALSLAALHYCHWPVYVQSKKVEDDYLFAMQRLKPEAIIYPMNLESHGWDGSRYNSFRADFIAHLVGFYSTNNSGVYLNNIIARWGGNRQITFFPHINMALEMLPPAFPGHPVPIDIENFTRIVGRPIDYILLYGRFSDKDSIVNHYESIIEKTYDCRLASPLGLVKLCRRL